MPDPRERFTSRVADYVRFRPGYPAELLDCLATDCGLGAGDCVADVGAGTGILTAGLLARGMRVFAVEPNGAMRRAAEERLGSAPLFSSVAGSAEAMTLPDGSVDGVVAAQAFHWFERDKAREEFARILKPGGPVALIWNDRRPRGNPFLEAYERLLQEWGTDYAEVNHGLVDEGVLASFFSPGPFGRRAFPNAQVLDLDGLKGRVLSASYMPGPGHPSHEPMLAALEALFAHHERDGAVTLEYDTRITFGPLLPR